MRIDGELEPSEEVPGLVTMPCCGSQYDPVELKPSPYGLIRVYCPNCERSEYE